MRAFVFLFGLVAVLGAQTHPAALTCELRILRTHIGPTDPIEVDVWIVNHTEHELSRPVLSPISSLAGLPEFRIRRVPDGLEYGLPPGLYGAHDWWTWYKAKRNADPSSASRLLIGPRQRVHLLQGDLKRTILLAREHCRRALADENRREAPDTESTWQEYESIVRFADDFLRGGTFEIRVHAYTLSPALQITVAPVAGHY